MPCGIVLKGIGGFYYILSDKVIYECKARGIFRKNDMTPLPGDRVNFSINDQERNLGNLDEILDRTSQLVRPAVANINQVIFVIAVMSPAPDFLLLDKLLATAAKEKIDAVICLNKIDLDVNDTSNGIWKSYSKAGSKILHVSNKTGQGLDELRDILKNRITVFSGQSGVGKSTILNRVMESNVMLIGELSTKIDRGKHTTRHAELVPLECGGFIVDTPGFSSFELERIECEELQNYYPEFNNYYTKCRFSGCSHINEPDCTVKEARDNGEIDCGRYERYVELFKYLKALEGMKYKNAGKKPK